MSDFARKKIWLQNTVLLFIILLLPAAAYALPVAVEQVEREYPLKHAVFFLVDEHGDIDIHEASAPLRQNHYRSLEDGIPLDSNGAIWLRFSLIKNNQALNSPRQMEARIPLFLVLGQEIRGSRLYIAENVSTNGEIKSWHESLPLGNGSFQLPDPDLLPLTIYVRVDGIPDLWFDPVLVRGDTDGGPFTWVMIMQLALGLALVLMVARGMTENGEWRFWAGAVLACAIIPSIFGQYGSEARIIYLMAMPRLLAPGLAIMLMPHLGRYLLNSRGSKPLDYMLIALSVPGVLIALAPLMPGLGWTARLLPLAPLALFPLIIIALVRLKSGQSGSLLYFLFTLFPFTGAALALASLLSPALAELGAIGPNLTTLGYLIGGWILAVGKPAEAKEAGDFFPLNDLFEDALPGGDSAHQHKGVRLLEKPQKSSGENAFTEAMLDFEALAASASRPDEEKTDRLPEVQPEEAEIAGGQPDGEIITPLPDAPEHKEQNLFTADESIATEVIDLGLDMDVFNEDANGDAPEDDTLHEGLEAALPNDSETPVEYSAEVAAPMQQDKNIIYIKDEEEPGLVILKPAGTEPIDGLATIHHIPAHNWEYMAISRLENALRAPYEQLVNQMGELKSRQELASHHIDGIDRSLEGLGHMLNNLERVARGEPLAKGETQTIFNLSQLIRRIHEELLPAAEERGITLSWFVSPGLPAYFKGPEQEIGQAVKFLLQGTLDGASSGAVLLSVRQGAGEYSGQIQFALQESGMHPSHSQRPSGWLNKAWELAAASGGSFNIDFIPGKGMAITLALPLQPVQEPPAAQTATHERDNTSAPAAFAPPITEESTPAGPAAAIDSAEESPAGEPAAEDDDILLLTDAIIPQRNRAAEDGKDEDNTAESAINAAGTGSEVTAAATEQAGTEDHNSIQTTGMQGIPASEAPRNLREDQAAGAQAAAESNFAEDATHMPADSPAAPENKAPHQTTMLEDAPDPANLPDAARHAEEPDDAAKAEDTVMTAPYASAENELAKTPLGGSSAQAPKEQPDLIVFSDDEIVDAPLSLTSEVSAPRPASTAGKAEKSAEQAASAAPREYIIIADMAASGRRFIARRLDGLPHKLVEARNADEIIRAVAQYPVGLIIIDADMPESDVKRALEKVADHNLRNALPPTPSLCLLSHESQAERLHRLGCRQTQVKSSSRVQFRQEVLRLCPHPEADPSELLPESPLLRAALQQNASPVREQPRQPAVDNTHAAQAEPQAEGNTPEEDAHGQAYTREPQNAPVPAAPSAKKSGRIPMLDLIVDALDDTKNGQPHNEGEAAQQAHSESRTTGAATALKAPYPLSSPENDFMEADMVPLIPGLLQVFQDAINDLAQARVHPDIAQIKEIAVRMAGQGSTFGLHTLERMARYVERAADAGDLEAIRDFSDELLAIGRRYYGILVETHEDYLKKN